MPHNRYWQTAALPDSPSKGISTNCIPRSCRLWATKKQSHALISSCGTASPAFVPRRMVCHHLQGCFTPLLHGVLIRGEDLGQGTSAAFSQSLASDRSSGWIAVSWEVLSFFLSPFCVRGGVMVGSKPASFPRELPKGKKKAIEPDSAERDVYPSWRYPDGRGYCQLFL